MLTLNLSQVSLNNWASGGQSSISSTGLGNGFINYKSGKISWDNTLDLAYGIIKEGKSKLRKSDDKIDFSSKLGYQTSKNWNLSVLLGAKSQFTDGYNYPNDSVIISRFAAPAYFILALGMEYKPSDVFTCFLSPLTGRLIWVNDKKLADSGAFGVEKATLDALGNVVTEGKRLRYEMGGYIKAQFKKDIVTNVNLQSKLELFSNYLETPENVDINWEVLLTMKVNSFLSASISTQLIYDDNTDISIDKNNDGVVDAIGPRVQFKEVLSVGLSVKL